MPEPVRPLSGKIYKNLTHRQKATVRHLKSAGLKPVVYRRKIDGRHRFSVHNPFSDLQRRARVSPTLKTARKYPQAFDTPAQRNAFKPKYMRRNIAKRTTRVKKGILDLFLP